MTLNGPDLVSDGTTVGRHAVRGGSEERPLEGFNSLMQGYLRYLSTQ